jgi:hypothetical protein
MRRFVCESCRADVAFDAACCELCRAILGYVPAQRTVRVLVPSDDAVSFSVDGETEEFWRCLNAAWGCNWMLPAGTGESWCRSCRLTRGRPDEARPDAVDAWSVAEASKRRLVHQLDELALPIEPRSDHTPDGLVFDLVHLPGCHGVTGHLDGVVTLDLAEADEEHREQLRRRLGEPFRTLIGNLRHEIGHHYWHRLVGQSDHLTTFRRLFGDERVDYAAALEQHYATVDRAWDAERFITGYAQAHPLEDWAETFAHYLHILDAADTAAAHQLTNERVDAQRGSARRPDDVPFAEILHQWRPAAQAINAIADSLGARPVYPLQPAGAVVEKFEFIHARVMSHTQREDFYTIRP